MLTVRARGTGDRAIAYDIDLPSGTEGVFSIDPVTGNITVGANGTSRLVIRDHNPTVFMFDAYAYYLQSGPSGNRVRSLTSHNCKELKMIDHTFNQSRHIFGSLLRCWMLMMHQDLPKTALQLEH